MMRPSILLALISATPSAAHAYHMEDSLRGGTSSGNPVGGSFGPEGWTVTGRADRIWWEIPRLGSGSIEFTVSNVTLSNLVVNDNEIFAMYEAGYGIEEPVRYSPEFRNNHYKCMIRVYGTAETGREGQQKLMWGMCPSGAPGYDGCGCGSFFEEPFGGSGAWDGTPQRFRVEWGSGITRMLRNGAEVVSIDWSESGLIFGPDTLHVSLGTSRPEAIDSASMPIGAIFSDVVVDGTEGPLATCSGPVETDAGPPPVVDAGSPPVSDAGAPGSDAGPVASGDASVASRDSGRWDPRAGGGGVSGSGCGCGASPADGGTPLALGIAAVVWLARRRRRA